MASPSGVFHFAQLPCGWIPDTTGWRMISRGVMPPVEHSPEPVLSRKIALSNGPFSSAWKYDESSDTRDAGCWCYASRRRVCNFTTIEWNCRLLNLEDQDSWGNHSKNRLGKQSLLSNTAWFMGSQWIAGNRIASFELVLGNIQSEEQFGGCSFLCLWLFIIYCIQNRLSCHFAKFSTI